MKNDAVMKILLPGLLLFLMFSSPPSHGGEVTPEEGSPFSEDIGKADQIGEEFQRQAPWSETAPGSGAYHAPPQPEEYLSPPEPEEPEPPAAPRPYCYNPYTGLYEYCYPGGYLHGYFHPRYRYEYLHSDEDTRYRFELDLPGFYLYWEKGGRCPPGYRFIPEWGCYRY